MEVPPILPRAGRVRLCNSAPPHLKLPGQSGEFGVALHAGPQINALMVTWEPWQGAEMTQC